ncbi:MAG TPA: CDP-alcohol phosphatidyltransferase family protein [Candidatus Acidoferrum sp.]|nr:CDP-alcohol phosphatidyltransferase family protein [Candidatus Acidoferrum sp.]
MVALHLHYPLRGLAAGTANDEGIRRSRCEPVETFDKEGGMTPNQVTAARVAAAFAAVALFTCFGKTLAADLAAVSLTIAAIALDGVDGYIARTRGLSTPIGAQLDIMGDRIVENLFFTFFAVSGLVSLWVPILFFVRGTLTDFLRGLAARAGRSGFGRNSMLETGWARALVASRASRASYAVLKCVCFCYLGLLLPLREVPAEWFAAARAWLADAGQVLVVATAIFCVVRAIPVLWEGRRYLAGMEKPAQTVAAQVTR